MIDDARHKAPVKPLSWDIEIGVLTNPRVWLDLFKVALAVYFLLLVLFGVAFGTQGDWEELKYVALAFPVAIVTLFLIGILGLTAVTGNRFRMRYEFLDEGIACKVTDRRARNISRATLLLGLVLGSLVTTGVGMTTAASEHRIAPWSRILRAKYSPRRHVIDLIGSWRSLLVVYCPPDLYDRVAAAIETHIGEMDTSGSQKKGTSLGTLLLWTIAVVAASLPLFVLPNPFDMDLLVPLLILCFALACVWLMPLLGYAVLAGVAVAVFLITAAGLERHTGVFLNEKYDYSGFESLHADEWSLIGLAAIGLLFLVWFAVRTIRGKGPSALFHDIAEG